MDRCRLLVASPAGLTGMTADGSLFALDPLNEFEQVNAVAAMNNAVWVAGTSRAQHPILVMFDAANVGHQDMVTLPADLDSIDALAVTPDGVVAAATVDDHGELLRLTPANKVVLIGKLAASPTRLVAVGDLFLVGTIRSGRTSLVTGSAPPWRSEVIGSDTDLRSVAASEHLLVGAVNDLSHGAPVGADFLVSTDGGRSWSRHPLPGAELGSIAIQGGYIYASMTRPGSSGTLYRTVDAQTWTPVTGAPPSESLPQLVATQGALWLIGDTVARLTL